MKESSQKKQLADVITDPLMREFLERIIFNSPVISGILDDSRRLLYANKAMLEAVSLPNFEEALTLRPGELLQCVNSELTPGGCGSAEACELCGAFDSMKKSKKEMESSTKEFRVLSRREGKVKSLTFKFTSTPFVVDDKFLYLIYLEDINSIKRQHELEKIFFHDIMNSIGSLKGVISLMKKQQKADPLHLNILEATYNNLFDTVSEQKQLTMAERRELELHKEEIDSYDLLIETTIPFNEYKSHRAEVIIAEDTLKMTFISDPALLSRVLVNMTKNAVEASDRAQIVTLGAKKLGDYIRFWVQNETFIPRSEQLLIFERSFSTKGTGRGLGTFSIKLLGEEYLGGKVDFTSDEEKGTTFWIDIPY